MRFRPQVEAPQRSSMENFLDEYQLVRLFLSFGGLVVSLVYSVTGPGNRQVLPVTIVLVLVGTHAVWCRLRHIRSPRTMLLLDLTLWGWVMYLLSGIPEVFTASYAFLTLLTVTFSRGVWMGVFLIYLTSWYGLAYFAEPGVNVDSVRYFLAVVFTMGGLALLVGKVRRWVGRLDADRSQMLGTVSHELRNNLTGMMGMTDLVSNTTDLSPDESKEMLDMAHQQAVDASEIVEDLLTVSRLEHSALRVDAEAVDLNHEVEISARRFRGEGAEVVNHLGSDLPMASGDSLRVRQVLRNLVSNAVRYGGESIEVTSRTNGERIQVWVSDDGDGVPPEDERTIFLPYRRSINARRDASSVGLGLWICRQLAHAMSGDLEYRRDDRTHFILTLRVFDTDAPTTSDFQAGLDGSGIVSGYSNTQAVPAVAI
jgi:signal transduction histidine kinase